ncbi:Glyoxylase, beta-lactamase superfamily II [Robiginitalea myxolifaciens]|uniref:Glyoxylase, beta-lactamase superfamily II n=1 Tax=Robiginitalea myxolifaciens TaxID=400055 RepID=A0A1I6FQM1_9FLAO|nr:MBL fold metallo-hydrolase [Robiginitalea myxolifaciens]SFR32243.1 Glyoxylase, beta-lactamase superfamily II [Robiginitalea myxolifaciens]
MKVLKLLLGILCISSLNAQRNWDNVEIRSEQLKDQIYVLYGAGGNMGLALGQEYAYLIDDQFGPLSEKILTEIRSLTDKPLKFVVNTHWHGDHTGGNANLAREGAIVISHRQVRERMSTPQDRGERGIVPGSPHIALAQLTFNEEMTIHLDSLNSMHLMYVKPSHTDGDTYVYFPEANVIHMGDNFISGYPYIDLGSGGDIDGLVSNLGMALAIVDEETRIIPGHGPVSSKKELQVYTDMVRLIRDRVKAAKDAGKTLEEVQSMGLTAEWDDAYDSGFINSERLLQAVYASVD